MPAHWGSGPGGGDSSTGVRKDAGISQGGTSADAGSGGSRDASAGDSNGGDPGSASQGDDDEEEPPASSGHPSRSHPRHGQWWFGGLRPGHGCALGAGADAEGLGTWLLVLSSVLGLRWRRRSPRA